MSGRWKLLQNILSLLRIVEKQLMSTITEMREEDQEKWKDNENLSLNFKLIVEELVLVKWDTTSYTSQANVLFVGKPEVHGGKECLKERRISGWNYLFLWICSASSGHSVF